MAPQQSSSLSLVILLVIFAGCVLAQHPRVPIAPCSGAPMTGKLLEVRVSNCNNNFPCILQKGTQVTVEFDYIPSAATNRITTGATARLGGIPLPFVGTNNQPACPRIVAKQSRQAVGCTTKAGEVYTYSNTFPILQIYPVTSVTVQWELIDSNRQKITCFTIPARIV
ncbi:NPC intracellular cholesterol transporter 2 homolog a-like [Daphnia pulicaria]|uniref:NPC intracellular cholesterol transporter 2 homolog a-like n=1 Tax=Daphnia pulicaria TaxID=35523 RepID=UPI001EEB805E|nr:NPC intracellular cholesterol transporter 2 homolog a-like [Daphnia pulicaria]